jgi:hypothetical protein
MALNAVLAKANCIALSELSRVLEHGSTHDSQPKVPTNMYTLIPIIPYIFFIFLFFLLGKPSRQNF